VQIVASHLNLTMETTERTMTVQQIGLRLFFIRREQARVAGGPSLDAVELAVKKAIKWAFEA
jgi:hypothetical protein